MVRRYTRRKKSSRTTRSFRAARTRNFVKRKKRQASKIFRRTGKVTKWMKKRRARARKEWYKLRDRIRFSCNNIYNSTNSVSTVGDVNYMLAYGKIFAIPNQGLGPSNFRGRYINKLIMKIRMTTSLSPTCLYQPAVISPTDTGTLPVIIPTFLTYRMIIYQVKAGRSNNNQIDTTGAYNPPNNTAYHLLAVQDTSAQFAAATGQLQTPGTMTPGDGASLTINNAIGPPTVTSGTTTGILSELLQFTPTPESANALGPAYFMGTDTTSGISSVQELVTPTASYVSLLNGQFRDGITKEAIILYDKTFKLGTNNNNSVKNHKIKIRPQPYRWQEQVGPENEPYFNISSWPVNCIYCVIIPIFNHYAQNPGTSATSYGKLDVFGNVSMVFTDD